MNESYPVQPESDLKSKTSDAVIEVSELTKRYGELVAIDKISLKVGKGKILGLIGPNGAGKTTTIRILVGLAKPTSGTARIAGVDCVKDSRKIKRLVGYLPDKFGSYDNMRVHEYLDFFGAAYGITRKKRSGRIKDALDITGANDLYDRYVSALSHGMQQRIGIARTLLHDPEVLILDEPANGLDPKARVEMRELLLHLSSLGKTLIVTSHILPELSRICDEVAIISQGVLRAAGPLADIMKSFQQTRWLEIQLANRAMLERARKIVLPFANSVATVSLSDTESTLRFPTQDNESRWGDILKNLIDDGLIVLQFREIQTDLEDAFLSVTGSSLLDESHQSSIGSRKL